MQISVPIGVAVAVAVAVVVVVAAAVTIGMAALVAGPNLFQIAIDFLADPMILHQCCPR
jgi:fumarate reductase subunit C